MCDVNTLRSHLAGITLASFFNDSDEEAAQFGGASTVDELYGVMQEITGYLGPTVLTTDDKNFSTVLLETTLWSIP
jgi:hypothetical protein